MRFLKWFRRLFEPRGQAMSMDFNRQYGRYYVVYPDGERTVVTRRDVADGYAEVFGGVVEEADRNEQGVQVGWK
jgi:hypothetical protein